MLYPSNPPVPPVPPIYGETASEYNERMRAAQKESDERFRMKPRERAIMALCVAAFIGVALWFAAITGCGFSLLAMGAVGVPFEELSVQAGRHCGMPSWIFFE